MFNVKEIDYRKRKFINEISGLEELYGKILKVISVKFRYYLDASQSLLFKKSFCKKCWRVFGELGLTTVQVQEREEDRDCFS